MAGLNKVMIIGNLGSDPEMKFLPSGTPVATFRIAVNDSYSGQDGERKEETEWFSIVAWRQLAEMCTQYLSKGREVYVEGRLRTRSWDGPDGQKRYRTEVVAHTVLFLDRQRSSAPLPGEQASDDVEPDDLPF